MAYNYNGRSERVRPVMWIDPSAQVPHPSLARRFCVLFNDSFFYDILTVKTAFYLMETGGIHDPSLFSQFPSFALCTATPPAESLSTRATVPLSVLTRSFHTKPLSQGM